MHHLVSSSMQSQMRMGCKDIYMYMGNSIDIVNRRRKVYVLGNMVVIDLEKYLYFLS